MNIKMPVPQNSNDIFQQVEQLDKQLNREQRKAKVDTNKDYKKQRKRKDKAETEQHED